MAFYEHTFIARPDLSGTQAQSLAEELAKLVADQGGQVKKTEYWGLRTLAYRVKKNRKGHYLHLNIDAPSATLDELERNERLHDDVLRYMTVKVDALDEGPSIFMQARSDRDGPRGRDRDGPRGRDRDGPRGDRDRGDRDRSDRDRGDRDRGDRGRG